MRIVGYCFALLLAATFTWGTAIAAAPNGLVPEKAAPVETMTQVAQSNSVDSCIATCGGLSYPGSTPPLGGDTVEDCVGSCSAYQFVPEGSNDASTAACVVVYTNCFVDRAACEATCRSR